MKKLALKVVLPAIVVMCCASTCFQNHPTTVDVHGNDTNLNASVTVEINTNLSAGVSGSYDPSTGVWNAGLVIVFKAAPPQEVVTLAKAAGAVAAREQYTYVITQVDLNNPSQVAFRQLADRLGASTHTINLKVK